MAEQAQTTAAELMNQAALTRTRPSRAGRHWLSLSRTLTDLASRHLSGAMVRCANNMPLQAPGQINLATMTIWLRGELLSFNPADINDTLTDEERGDMLVLLGVLHHEIGHGLHTKPGPADSTPALQRAIVLLEEPRMEAQTVRSIPRAQPLLQAAAARIESTATLKQQIAEHGLSRTAAGQLAALTIGRVHAQVLDDDDVRPLRPLIESVLGADDNTALDQLLADVCQIADDDHTALRGAANRYLQIIDDPDETEDRDGDHQPGPLPANQRAAEADTTTAGRSSEPARSTQQAQQAIDDAFAAGSERAKQHPDAQQAVGALITKMQLQQAAGSSSHARGLGIGLPAGRLPRTKQARRPLPQERAAARRLAGLLRSAQTRQSVREGRMLPPGKFAGRGAINQAAELAQHRPLTAEPFRRTTTTSKPLTLPQVAITVDTSGSMGQTIAAAASTAWILGSAIKHLNGQLALSSFGDTSQLIRGARDHWDNVPAFGARGGTGLLGPAMTCCWNAMDAAHPSRPRLHFVITDGYILISAGERRQITALKRQGIEVLVLGIGACIPVADVDEHPTVVESYSEMVDVLADRTLAAITKSQR